MELKGWPRGPGVCFNPVNSSGKGLNNLTFYLNKLEGTELDLRMNSSESLFVDVTPGTDNIYGSLTFVY